MLAGWGDDLDDILKEAREAFDLAADAEIHNREDAKDDLRFARLGEQWPESVKKARRDRPMLTINRLPSFIRQVVNDSRQNRPQIKVLPVDSGADKVTADIYSGLIRNIEAASSADVAYDTAVDFAATMGFGYIKVGIEYESDDSLHKDLCIKRVANPFAVYADPFSDGADSADWDTCFVVERMSFKQFERRYKGALKSDWESSHRNLQTPWVEAEEVQVAEYWRRDEVTSTLYALSDGGLYGEEALKTLQALGLGLQVVGQRPVKRKKVTQYIVSGAEVLDEVSWAGQYIPVIPVYGEEINVEGKRHFMSLIRHAKDAQRMLNYWRSTSTEVVALAPRVPFIGPLESFKTDAAKWETINTETHAFVEYDGPIAPMRQPMDTSAGGAMQEALAAQDDLKSIMGMFDAALGARSNETSGKAIMARQREGDIATFHFIDNLSRAIRHTGRVLIDLIPQVYSADRIIRILGEDGTPESVAIGKPRPGIEKVYDLGAGRYDLTVTAGPGFTTRREEAASQMMQLIQSFPGAAPVIGDLVAKNLDWPGAEQIAERLQKLSGAGEQTEPPVDREKVASLSLDGYRAATERYKAETERMAALAPAMDQAAVQAVVLQTLRDLMAPDGPSNEVPDGSGMAAMQPQQGQPPVN